jgi:hypothetical protein
MPRTYVLEHFGAQPQSGRTLILILCKQATTGQWDYFRSIDSGFAEVFSRFFEVGRHMAR